MWNLTAHGQAKAADRQAEPGATSAAGECDGAEGSKHSERKSPPDAEAAVVAVRDCRKLLSDKGTLEGIGGSRRPNLVRANLEDANLYRAHLVGAIGLTQEMLRRAQPSPPPPSLPAGLSWPFEEGADGRWRLKP